LTAGNAAKLANARRRPIEAKNRSAESIFGNASRQTAERRQRNMLQRIPNFERQRYLGATASTLMKIFSQSRHNERSV
jgi:hypothetical protein